MKSKTIRCLKLCSLRIGSIERREYYDTLLAEFPAKVISRKLEELDRRGYIDCTLPMRAYLTSEGRVVLNKCL